MIPLNAMRILLLSGAVALTSSISTVAGKPLAAPADAAAVKETVKANSQFAVDPAATDDGLKAEVKVLAENVAVPKQMSLAGDMIRGKVLSVGSSKSFGTPVSYTTVRLSVLEVYGGSAEVGKPVELVISGWLESEKKEAALFEKAMKQDKEVVVIMEKSYQPFTKSRTSPTTYVPPLPWISSSQRYRAPYDASDSRSA